MPDAPPRDPLTAELAAIRARDGKTGRGLSSNVTDYLASQRDVRRLLAAVRVARDLHQPRPQRRYQPCEIHGGGNLAVDWVREVVESCPSCSVASVKVCVTCRHPCPDDDCWPCVEYQRLTTALTGEDNPR